MTSFGSFARAQPAGCRFGAADIDFPDIDLPDIDLPDIHDQPAS
jgi:hypothetical protein